MLVCITIPRGTRAREKRRTTLEQMVQTSDQEHGAARGNAVPGAVVPLRVFALSCSTGLHCMHARRAGSELLKGTLPAFGSFRVSWLFSCEGTRVREHAVTPARAAVHSIRRPRSSPACHLHARPWLNLPAAPVHLISHGQPLGGPCM